MHLLHRDLILESVRVELEQKRSLELFCFSFCSTREVPLGKNLVEPRRLELLTYQVSGLVALPINASERLWLQYTDAI